jgi:hypothetical protein
VLWLGHTDLPHEPVRNRDDGQPLGPEAGLRARQVEEYTGGIFEPVGMNTKVAVGFDRNARNFAKRPETHRCHVVRLPHLANQ